MKLEKILIFRLSALGDVALVIPVLLALQEKYPNLEIHFASKPKHKALFQGKPKIQFIEVDTTKKYKGLLGIFQLFLTLQKEKYDAYVDLHRVIRSMILGLLFKFFGVQTISLNKNRKGKRKLCEFKPNSKKERLPHITQTYLKTIEKLGLTIPFTKSYFLEKFKLSENILNKLPKGSERKKIGIAPFAFFTLKIYPFVYMKKVIDLLSTKYELYFFGYGKFEMAQIENLRKNCEHTFSKTNILNFEEEFQFISNLDLMISMDSANGHLASLFNIPVITLWGATHPKGGFQPYQQPLSNQICPDMDKYPCLPSSIYGKKTFADYQEAMWSIDPEQVVKKAIMLLENI